MAKAIHLSLSLLVLLGSGATFAKPSSTTGLEEIGQMVVMKVRPEYASMLPSGVASSVGIPSVDIALSSAGAGGVKQLHPKAIIREDLPRLDLWLEVQLSPGIDPASVVQVMRSRPELLHVELVEIPLVEELPDDPNYGNQVFLPQIMAPEAWDYQKGDSAIVVAIVDNGTDINHPDLWDNVWTNELEAMGLPGVDDDGNGYVDDIHGYDVAHNDPDVSPTPPDAQGYWMHGTQCAGNAAAVTDNGVGVAAVSWNCEYMPVKCSYDTSPQSVAAGYQGIQYAANSGADVISCSWGHHGSPSQYDQEVINYATGLGSMVVASAGNEPIGDFHWPSSYQNVVSVTWVNTNDIRAGSATWGRTVDISAPGVNTYSTRPNGGYGPWSGSSASAPIAAGLAGLIKSWQPGLTPYELSRQLILTADNIDDLNPGYEGLLGIGRINAYRAVTETELEEHPYVEMIGWTVSDPPPGGDGDSWILQGEEAELWINYWSYTVSPAEDATITLTTDAPGVEILNGISNEGTIPADTTATSHEALTFRVASDAPSQRIEMLITFEAAGGFWQQDTLGISVGLAPVLLVDDDDGDVNVEGYYKSVMDTLGVPYLVWNHMTQSVPDSLTLLNFPVVVWSCEWNFPSLEPEDRASLASYLNNGGSLYMSGQDIGWDLCDPASENTSPEAVAWYNQYLKARYILDDSEIQSVNGVEADPIGDGLSFAIYQPGRAPENQYPSVVDPHGSDTHTVFRYTPTMDAAVRYREDFGVVYTAFGFEAVASGANLDPVDYTGMRTELMTRVLNYLSPVKHTPLMDTEQVDEPVTITATMTAPGAPESLWVIYTRDPSLGWTTALMDEQGDGTYETIYPAPNEAIDFYYYFEARNTSFTWRYPLEGELQIHIGLDTVVPQLRELTQLHAAINPQVARTIQVRATDNLGLDLQSGMVYYMAGDTQGESPLSFQSWIGDDAVFEGAVEPIGSYGDTVYYFASVADTAITPNRGYSDTLFYVHGLEDFEANLDAWDPETEWVRQTGGNPHSGDWIVRDSDGFGYPNNADNSMTLADGLDLSGVTTARVSFWIMHGLEDDHDYCYLEASRDGNEWTQLVELTGRVLTWTWYDASLDEFTGAGGDQVFIRFRLVSDEETTLQGIYLDDVLIETEGTGAWDDPTPLPIQPTLTIRPNPSGGTTHFHIAGVVKPSVRIYDAAGRLVRTLWGTEQSRTLQWNGLDEQGRSVSSGLYFVTVAGSQLQGKIVLIR